jgi:hypothetical protein
VQGAGVHVFKLFGFVTDANKCLLPGGISPIFYEQLCRTKVFRTAFMCLQIGYVIFWRKDFGAKAANKMLVKLTPGGIFNPV